MNFRTASALIVAFVALLLTWAFLGCGKGSSTSGLNATGTVPAGNGNTGMSLAEIIEKAESYPSPDDVDEGVYDELKSELLRLLGKKA